MKNQTIVFASDHAGFELKEYIKHHLISDGYKIDDVGAAVSKAEDDYPEYMAKAASKVAMDVSGDLKAIIFGGSGQGEAMVANRFPGVRAAVWYGGNDEIIIKSREHNNSNILSIGARFVSKEEAIKVVLLWLNTPFSNEERHARRIEQMDSIE